jgi:hypothetical protein
MLVSAVIDTVIGLVLMYFVLSLLCTVINEYIATWLALRATTLQDALQNLLDVPQLRRDFYNHGLIDGASAAVNGKHVSYLSGTTFATALLGSLDPNKPIPAFADLSQAIQNLPDSNIRDALLSHVTTAQGDVDRLRTGVATWFDQTMERVSGVYKRYLKWLSLAVGLGLAIAINADTFAIANALWGDDALRTEMSSVAGQVLTDASKSNQATPPTTVTTISAVKNAEDELRPLPLGWTGAWPQRLSIVWKLAGLLLTALALSLGAPFWFDLLSMFMNVRGTGPKPDMTPQTAAPVSPAS